MKMGGHFHEMTGKCQVSDCYHKHWVCLPWVSNLVHVHNMVRLPHSNLSRVRRESKTRHLVRFLTQLQGTKCLNVISVIERVTYFLTLELAGFVANLSRFSPSSSNSHMTLSTVHTASLLLHGAHAIATTLETPSYNSTQTSTVQERRVQGVTHCHHPWIAQIVHSALA